MNKSANKPVLPGVFRAYDIRGVVGKDFDENWAELLGKACGTFMRSRKLQTAVIGHDCRHSSPAYAAAVAKGMLSTGIDVTTIGMVPTPVFYYAVKKLGRDGGVIVTASHNPPEYNGFKVWAGETTLHGEEISELCTLMQQQNFATGSGVHTEYDISPTYLEDLAERMPLDRKIKVVVDGGNGAAGDLCATLLEKAGAEVVRLFCEPDGDFPNHHPDPVVEKNLTALKETVVREKAALGIGLDGDGDRIGVVDEKGQIVHGDRLLAVFARDLLSRNPGATIIGEVKCSHLLYRDIEQHGGRAVMGVTGHSVMKARMIETGALLAGEMSGHMFFAENYYGFDDALWAALLLLSILSHADKPISAMPGDWPETSSTPELRIDCPEEIKFELVERAKERFGKDYEIITVDGVRVLFPDGWALVRASNTQPALSMRFEAESEDGLAAIRDAVERPVLEWIRQAQNN